MFTLKKIRMTKETLTQQALNEFLETQDFYELMQMYRQMRYDAFHEFEAVKSALRAAIAQPEPYFPFLIADLPPLPDGWVVHEWISDKPLPIKTINSSPVK